MLDLLNLLIPNVMSNLNSMWIAFLQTIQMVFFAGLISAIFGVFFGTVMVVTRQGGIMECKPVWWVLDKVVNLFRCIPFLIMAIAMAPVTRMLVGTSIHVIGAIPPLVVATVPFFSRQIESSLLEVDPGLIEASQAMGDSPMQTIFRVYLKESIPGIIRGSSITLIALIGYTTISGMLGAGGLGDYALNHGYFRYKDDVTLFVIFILLLITTLIQSFSDFFCKKTTH